jgi:circadian clock protein KaiC
MATKSERAKRNVPLALEKSPTGIDGLDQVTKGGLPKGRPTLVCGSAGCGKSLFGIEFLVRGATQFGEPGVLMTFEETAEDLAKNVRSLGFDLDDLVARKKIIVDYVRVERSEIEENGEYDLEGLFIRLNHAIDSIGAKRVMLDTIETLFSGLANQAILRAELRRMFGWLREKGMTTVITGERGDGTLTRQGLEEYVSDCVILLDHRVTGQVSTRRMRVVKYRGSTHGTNEYPFLIDEQGISVLPITSSGLDYAVSDKRITSGIPALDEMLGGDGFYRGSTVMLSGTAGTGKSSVASHFADATCRNGERAMYFSFEESPAQIIRNMRSVGVDLEPHVKSGKLQFHTSRPTLFGLEMHLVTMHKLIQAFKPAVVVVDPITSFLKAGSAEDAEHMLVRMIDVLRANKITAFLVSLTSGGSFTEATEVQLSSLVDTWMLLRDIELAGERNRGLYILKSRGMAHSNQIREFLLTKQGVQLIEAYVGAGGVMTGSARVNQLAQESAAKRAREGEAEVRRLELERKRRALDARIEALRAEFAADESEVARVLSVYDSEDRAIEANQAAMSVSRRVSGSVSKSNGKRR